LAIDSAREVGPGREVELHDGVEILLRASLEREDAGAARVPKGDIDAGVLGKRRIRDTRNRDWVGDIELEVVGAHTPLRQHLSCLALRYPVSDDKRRSGLVEGLQHVLGDGAKTARQQDGFVGKINGHEMSAVD